MHASSLPGAARYDDPLLAILARPLGSDEGHADGYARKEAEFRDVVEQLPLSDARGLLRRLSIPKAGDALADRFGRLTAERRERLIAFVAAAPRRAALASIANAVLR